jgi:prepilin peptidase CpaA
MINSLALLIFPAFLAYAAVSDMMTMRISNRISFGLGLGFIVLAFVIGMPLNQFGVHILTAVVVLLVTFSMFAAGWIGGGDAKLAAATALWLGFPLTIDFLLMAAILGGVLTLFFLLGRRVPLSAGLQNVAWISRLHSHANGVPYGIALAAAGMMVYADSVIFKAFGA